MKAKLLLIAAGIVCFATPKMQAVDVTVTMNSTTPTMTIQTKATGAYLETGAPESRVYNFTADPGEYIITGIAKDGETVNGTIEVVVDDAETQAITVRTCTAYATNKHDDNTSWTIENGDYTIDARVSSREGVTHAITIGESTTAGRKTFLALNGDSYYVSFIPSAEHQAEGYVTLYKQGTLTSDVNIYGGIPMSHSYTVTMPKDAYFEMNIKFGHFVDFTRVSPVADVIDGDLRKITYNLAESQTYNYRTSMDGLLTMGGYIYINKDESKRPVLNFSEADYKAFGPKTIKHDVSENGGYETGDIFVNINKEGHLKMKVGDTFKAHAMRTWQLTDNSTNNYFIEPDFHYTVLTLDGKPSSDVIEISDKQGSAWADIKAVGEGTAIVLVTYDAIGLNYYASSTGVKTAYMGGEYWGAIWPENTAAYVVTVGNDATDIKPNMLLNGEYNKETLKLAGEYVDAEHDVFYYLDTTTGYAYTFKPEGVTTVKMAYPVIGEQMARYTGFGDEGVTANEDGSYTLLLKEGRQIVQLTDASGKSVYQVLTAKPCHREIVNVTRPGSQVFQPGDKLKVQYSGLRHPANKLAGIYNMSAYVTYNGVPNGTSLILSANQYTFGSAATAQAVTLEVPADMDLSESDEISLTAGVLQVNGYGDPIGNHRNIDPVAGRSPNFTAIAHKTYFGAVPEVVVKLTPYKSFKVKFNYDIENGSFTVTHNGTTLEPDADGLYEGTYGGYDVVAVAPGYRCLRQTYTVADDAEGLQTFTISPVAVDDNWYGSNTVEPSKNDNGYYEIASAAELAWLRDAVNNGEATAKAVLTKNIDLADYDWAPIGSSSSKVFGGELIGCGHRIDGLYINNAKLQQQGLFGYVKGTEASPAKITGITVSGEVTAKNTVAALVAQAMDYVAIDTCANYATVRGSNFVAGIVGTMSKATTTVSNCYNVGDIYSESRHAGICGNLSSGDPTTIKNVYNIGVIEDTAYGHAIAASTKTLADFDNAYANADARTTGGYTLVTDEVVKSGELAYKLGKAFTQEIDSDPHPRFGSSEVYYDEVNDKYTNSDPTGVEGIAVDTAVTPLYYYNMQGVRSDRPFNGVNIVVMSDGSVSKTVIK